MKHLSRIAFVLLLVVAFLLGACSVGVVGAEQKNPIKIWYQNENAYVHTWIVVDDTTGVNYIALTTEQSTHDSLTCTITPRLNPDGTLYVTP